MTFLFFISFHCASPLLLSPPFRCSSVPVCHSSSCTYNSHIINESLLAYFMRILNSLASFQLSTLGVHYPSRIPFLRVANLAILKPNFEIVAFLTQLVLLENIFLNIFWICSVEKAWLRQKMSELHIQFITNLFWRVCDHAGCKGYCKDFTVVLKIFNGFNNKRTTV